MSKLFYFLLTFLFLTNCAAPGTALLSPIITGAKTKSAHQASISLASSISSNQFIKKHENEINKIKKKFLTKSNKAIHIKKNNNN
tara:strand:+ start:1207 stop:1461 length:255 start_codon:yes stop_codon:yes gene_type:complete